MIYKVDYLIVNKEGFDNEKRRMPHYIVCEDFDSALATAEKFESDNVVVHELSVHVSHDNIAIARGYKGVNDGKAKMVKTGSDQEGQDGQ